MASRWVPLLALGLALPACKSEGPAPAKRAGSALTQAAPAPKPAPPPDAEVMPGRKLGPLTLGDKPPDGHDGSRAAADGGRTLYWSQLGVEAALGKDGAVAAAFAHSPDSDPFFGKAYAGKTAEGVGIGASAADVKAKLGPCEENTAPSAFVSDRVTLSCKGGGLTLDLAKPGGSVIAMGIPASK